MHRNADELLAFIFERIGKIATYHKNEEILEELAEMARDIVFADRCTIWVLDTNKEKLWTKVANGIGFISMDSDSGIVGATIKDGEATIINEIHTDKRFNSEIDRDHGYKTENMMVIPMKNSQGVVIGAIQVINKKSNHQFSDKDLKHLMLTVTYIAETIKSTLLIEEIEATQKELIKILGSITESRSRETSNHIKRVGEYSYVLAEMYGLDKKTCELLRDVSPLHDIGKLAISDTILHKPGKLNEAERAHMMMHPALGYNMLKDSDRELIKAGAIVAHEHHEMYDGTGYPNQLKGEEIHIFGRIVALADVYDALSTDRSYKKSWEHEKILQYINNEKGKHFDPVLVEILLENIDRFEMIREEFRDVFQ
jgi:HD-GYP domain-containing protein (c-di-GMP phosphodiesterase class II)